MVYIKKTKEYLLHLSAKEDVFDNAKSLRSKMTQSEIILWKKLKNKQVNGLKFRRQHPVHYYIADFYCHEKKLIIEIDGGIHKTKPVAEHDANRSSEFERYGIRVIRFTNEQVSNSINEVIEDIRKFTDNNL